MYEIKYGVKMNIEMMKAKRYAVVFLTAFFDVNQEEIDNLIACSEVCGSSYIIAKPFCWLRFCKKAEESVRAAVFLLTLIY